MTLSQNYTNIGPASSVCGTSAYDESVFDAITCVSARDGPAFCIAGAVVLYAGGQSTLRLRIP